MAIDQYNARITSFTAHQTTSEAVSHGWLKEGDQFLRVGLGNNKTGLFIGTVAGEQEDYAKTTKTVHQGGPEATARRLGYRYVLYRDPEADNSRFIFQKVTP